MQLSGLGAGLGARLDAALARTCPGDAPLGVAVSGGGDSMALLLALAARARSGGPAIRAVTVDHGLRAGSADEARAVAETCAGLAVPHETLAWTGWDGRGNLQDVARRARLSLIADWARGNGIGRVALGHTRDDQAETVLMRLARGAGVDGLSGMSAERRHLGVTWLRPFLDISRADLRAWLTGQGARWIDDPSNADPRFDRVQTRQVLAALAPLGITGAGLAETAARLGSSRAALDACTAEAAVSVATEDRGDVVLSRDGLAALPEEIARRLVVSALCWVSSADYPPRAAALAETLLALETAPRATIHGCLIARDGQGLRISRECAAVAGTVCAPSALWDGRWRMTGPAKPGDEVRALGESGLAACPDWRETGLPRASLLASPAIWRRGRVIGAPLAGQPDGWHAVPATTLRQRILSH